MKKILLSASLILASLLVTKTVDAYWGPIPGTAYVSVPNPPLVSHYYLECRGPENVCAMLMGNSVSVAGWGTFEIVSMTGNPSPTTEDMTFLLNLTGQ